MLALLSIATPVTAQELVRNGTFNTDVSQWTHDTFPPNPGSLTWSSSDANGSATSGSALLVAPDPEFPASASQCVTGVTPGTEYVFSAAIQVESGRGVVSLSWATNCSPLGVVTFFEQVRSGTTFVSHSARVPAPSNANSAYFLLRSSNSTSGGGRSRYDSISLQPAPPPVIVTGVLPLSAVPGTDVTISGSGFSANAVVMINGVTAAIMLHTATQIVVRIPNLPPGPADITVTVGANSATLTALQSNFQILQIPVIVTGVLPLSAAPGTDVTINGSGFTANAVVTINGVTATIISHSPTQLVVRVPNLPPGPADVTVTVGASSATLTALQSNFQVLAAQIPAASDAFLMLLLVSLALAAFLRLR